MNATIVVGNLTRDPELRYTTNGVAVAKFGLAVNRSYTNRNGGRVEQTDFFTVNAWRSLAENAAQSLHKGDRILVGGRLHNRSWEAEDHTKHSTVEIEAEEIAASVRFATVAITKARAKDNAEGSWEFPPEEASAS